MATSTANRVGLLLLAVISLQCFLVQHAEASDDCVHTIYIRTGSIWKAGTDSKVSVVLYGSKNEAVTINDLQAWGGDVLGQDRQFFQRGALDILSGSGKCLSTPICKLKLTSDGTGDNHGWYVNYVEVTSTGAHITCTQHTFTVEKWLATDAYPYSLTAEIDDCSAQSQSYIRL